MLPPFHLHVDCAGTVSCLQSRAKGLDPSNKRAHMWGKFWAAFEPNTFDTTKVKAHASAVDVDRGLTTPYFKAGNDAADDLARKGALLHPTCPQDALLFHGLTALARHAALWAGRCSATLTDAEGWDSVGVFGDLEPDPEDELLEEVGFDAGPPAEVGDTAAMTAEARLESGFRCRGHNLAAAAVEGGSGGEVLLCLTCGAYSGERAVGLGKACAGREAHPQQRRDIALGFYPRRRDLTIGPIRGLTVAQVAWISPVRRPRGEARPPPPAASSAGGRVLGLNRQCILSAFGVLESDVDGLAAWAASLRAKPTDQPPASLLDAGVDSVDDPFHCDGGCGSEVESD